MSRSPRLVSLLAAVLFVAACAALPPEKPIVDANSIAGKWQGWATDRNGNKSQWIIDSNADGTGRAVSADGKRESPFTFTIADGKVHWQGSDGKTGTTTLHEGNGKRILRAVADDGSFTMDETPAQ